MLKALCEEFVKKMLIPVSVQATVLIAPHYCSQGACLALSEVRDWPAFELLVE